MYGKIVNNVLVKAPKRITIDGMVYYNPTVEIYKNCGYLPVRYTDMPVCENEEQKHYESSFIEQNGEIVQLWAETEPPIQPLSIEDRISAVEAKQNSLSEELSVTMEAVDALILGGDVE